MSYNSIENICNSIMRAVVASDVLKNADDASLTRAVEIMRAEVKALLFGPEYADERALVLSSPMNIEAIVLTSIAASCILKIRGIANV
jgi:hypothetical protein